MSENNNLIQPMTIDQLAGAFALAMGAIGSVLLVIWQSRCRLRVNCCYVFRCDREPPPDKKEEKKKVEEVIEEDEDNDDNVPEILIP